MLSPLYTACTLCEPVIGTVMLVDAVSPEIGTSAPCWTPSRVNLMVPVGGVLPEMRVASVAVSLSVLPGAGVLVAGVSVSAVGVTRVTVMVTKDEDALT